MEILKIDGLNPSGIERIDMLPAFKIAAIGYPDTDNQVDLFLAPNAEWENVYFTPKSGRMEITPDEDGAGDFYQIALTFSIPKFRGKIARYFDENLRRDNFLRITDRNGNKFLLGEIGNYPVIKIEHKSNFDETNAVLVRVELQGSHPPYLIKTQENVNPDFASADFSTDFYV